MGHLESVLLVVNPTAGNGAGAAAGQEAARVLRAALGQAAVAVASTTGPSHATEIAARAEGVGTVVALGGDGVVHEVACGLMRRPPSDRPALGVIPCGSGNDYARAIGVPVGVQGACEALLRVEPRPTDVGRVNGRHFVETLSFGLDAAIALDTVERRVRTGRTGTALYMAAGLDQLMHHLVDRRFVARLDDGGPEEASSITFAVQVGPYYGGGFKICPDAALDDGLLDVCVSHPPLGAARALGIFLCAKAGRHTGFPQVELRRCRSLQVDFDEAPPAQMDGERIEAASFDVGVEARALRVLRP